MADAVPPPTDRTPWWHRTLLPCVFFGLLIPFAVAMGVLSWLLNSRIAHWLGFGLVLCVFTGGCASWSGAATKAATDASTGFWHTLTAPGNAPSYAIVGLLGGFCLVVAVGTAFASIWIPLIPRKAAVAALLMSIGLFALHRLLSQYLGVLVLLVVVGGIVAVAPLLFGWVRRSVAKAGERLALTDPRGGVAVQATVNPKVMAVRKQALTRWEAIKASKERP